MFSQSRRLPFFLLNSINNVALACARTVEFNRPFHVDIFFFLLFIRFRTFNVIAAIFQIYIHIQQEFNKIAKIMSASKRFRFSEWRNSLAPPDNSLIEINDDLSIEFDESQNSSTCEILIKNYGYRKITIAGVQYERLLLQLTHEPESGAIEPFGFVNYSFKAIHFTDRRISSAVVRFLFADHDQKVITRTISVSYNNNARNTGMNILNRTKFFYDIPQVFIEATDPTLQPSKINDLVDALVPAFNEMIYENYQAHFHGLLYLEEIAIKREYEHLVRKNVAFRENGNYFEVDFKHSQRLLLGIGKKICIMCMKSFEEV